MREHQIVITLKPDQFLEVQRLARAANAKSMGVFVRQKLLAALGIEGTLSDERIAGADGTEVDLDAIVADLKRMHGELKAFVAESLSLYSPEAFGQSESAPDDDSEQLNVFGMIEPADDPMVSQAVADAESIDNDELEKVADRAFAISPRLGAIADQAPPPSPLTETNNSLSRHEVHYRRDVHREHQPAVDPLAKLLSSDDLVKKPIPKAQPIDDDDEEFNVPLSIAERRRILAESEVEPALEAQQKLEPLPVENFTEAVEEVAAHSEDGSTTQSQQVSSPKNELGGPLGYPPLSGSPPPKRRQV